MSFFLFRPLRSLFGSSGANNSGSTQPSRTSVAVNQWLNESTVTVTLEDDVEISSRPVTPPPRKHACFMSLVPSVLPRLSVYPLSLF